MNYSDLNSIARVYFDKEEKVAFLKKLGYVIMDVPTYGWVSVYHNSTEDYTSKVTVAVKNPKDISYNTEGYASDNAMEKLTVDKIFDKEIERRIKDLLLV